MQPTDTDHKADHGVDHVDNTDEHLANLANQEEHQIGRLEAVKRYPRFVAWCLYGSWCLILASFENLAGGQVLGIPKFRKDFGHAYQGDYVLDGNWQSAINGAPMAAVATGTLAAAWLADRIGRKYTIAVGLLIGYAGITCEITATTIQLFFVGKFINGFAIGTHNSVAVSYVGELAPLALRGIMTAICAFAFTLGPFIGSLIMNYTSDTDSRWAYRALFSSQYGFAAIATLFWPFMPESPWWLVSRGRETSAKKSLHSLGLNEEETSKKIANMKQTLSKIRAETAGATYLECFKVNNIRRTFVSIAPLLIQALSGVIFIGSYFTYYVQLAGYSVSESFRLQIAQQTLSIVGNVMSWFLIDRVGRRDLTFWGLAALTAVLMVTGGLATRSDRGSIQGVVTLELFYVWCYNISIGATAWALLAETPTSRLRVKTVAVGVSLQNSLFTMWQFVIPFIFNPDQANLGAKTAFIYGGIAVLCLLYLWFFQPETAKRSYEELDEMFMKRVPARDFKKFKTETEIRGTTAMEMEVAAAAKKPE